MSKRKDSTELVRLAEKQGWTVTYTGAGHYKFRNPKGAVVFVPSTPGGARSRQNSRAILRRHGLQDVRKGG